MNHGYKTKSGSVLHNRYRKLLRQDWDEDSVHSVLKLLADQVPAEVAKELTGGLVYPKMRGALEHITADYLPSLPKSLPTRNTASQKRTAAEAIQSASGLTAQALFAFEQSDGFFLDTQSLLFLIVAHVLWPRLESLQLTAESSLLANAMHYHYAVIWEHDPSHQQSLRATLAGLLGNAEVEGQALLSSYNLAQPEDEDFLTKAQAVWMHFCEQHQFESAVSFLLNVYRTALPHDFEELREMIGDTMKLQQSSTTAASK